MKFTTARLRDTGLARTLEAFFAHLQERLDVDSIRVGDTTKLDYSGDITCADLDAEAVDTEAFTMATGATAGYVLGGDADGVASWVSAGAAGAGGATTNVQYNTGGALDGEAAFAYTAATNTLVVENIDCAAIDSVAITMATGAGANKVLTSNAAGVASWETHTATPPGGATTNVQYNTSGAFDGEAAFAYTAGTNTLTVDHVACPNGTETDEVINIDRAIDGSVTKSAVTVTEARSGTVAVDAHAAFDYAGTLDGTVFVSHAGHKATITFTSGTSAGVRGFSSVFDVNAGTVSTPACYYAEMDAEISPAYPHLYSGVMALDGASTPMAAPMQRAGLSLSVNANSTSETFGATTQAENAGTGLSCGYDGYGYNTSADTSANAVGLRGRAASTSGLEIGVLGRPTTPDANAYALCGRGHQVNYYGNTYLVDKTADPTVALAYASNKTHFNTTDYGCLYVEDVVEVDGILYADGGAVVTGDLTVTGELKGARVQVDGAESNSSISASQYLDMNNGLIMTNNRGYPTARAGSILDAACTCVVNSYTPGAELHIDVCVDGTPLAGAEFAIVGTGYVNWSYAGARGGATFTANQNIQLYLDIIGTANIGYPVATAGLQLDT